MNKYIFLIISAFILQATFICGCTPSEEEEGTSQKPQEPEKPQDPEKVLNASPLTLSFRAEGESQTINVTSNTDWQLTHNPQTEAWCLPDKTSGTGNASIRMTATNNPIDQERTDTYTLSIEGKELTIHLSQEAADLRVPLVFTSPVKEFKEGDQVGLFIANRLHNSNTPAQISSFTGNQANNVRMTKQADASWTASEEVFWKNPFTVVDAYAYYPWRQVGPNDSPNNWRVSVEKDQSTQTGLLTSGKPRYGTTLNTTPGSDGNLDVLFIPVTAKLNIIILLMDEAKQIYQIKKIQINSVYTEGGLNLNTGQIQAQGETGEISMSLNKDGADQVTTQSYLIPQLKSVGNIITLTYLDTRYNETINIPVTIETAINFEAGKQYDYVIRLYKTTDRITLENVSISEWDKEGEIEFPFN